MPSPGVLQRPEWWLAGLTRRQRECALLVVQEGLTNREIAAHLRIEIGTVKDHLGAVYDRLEVDGRLGLILGYWSRASRFPR